MTAGRAWGGRTLLFSAAMTCCTLGCWLTLHPVSFAKPVSRRLPRMIVPAATLADAELTMRPLDEYAALSSGPEPNTDSVEEDADSMQDPPAGPARPVRDADAPPVAISPP